MLLPLIGVVGGSLAGISFANQRHPLTNEVRYSGTQTFELVFDAEGENDNQLKFLSDRKNDTVWSTESLSKTRWASKEGVGVILKLVDSKQVSRLHIVSRTKGWTGNVFVSDRIGTDLASWGVLLGKKSNIPIGESNIDFSPATGRYVLLWITDPGPPTPKFASVKIAELSLRG